MNETEQPMRNKIWSLCLAAFWMAALVGCGKSDTAAPAPAKADEGASISTPATKTPPTPITNDVPSTAGTANKSLEAVVTAPAPTQAVERALAETIRTSAPTTDKPLSGDSAVNTGLAGLSQDQMVQGLKDALGKSLQQAVNRLGHEGGFVTNLNVRIPMPDQLKKVETTLRSINRRSWRMILS
jgi:hypothetical protein